MMNTVNAYPYDIGFGYFFLDIFCIIVLWGAGLVNGYLGLFRINSVRGIDLVARRMVAAGFLGQAINFSFRMWQSGGDLLVTPQAEVLYVLVAFGSCLLGLNRVKLRRNSTE